MFAANKTPLPRSESSQSFNFMPRLLAQYKLKSIAPCEFTSLAFSYPIGKMKTVSETRRDNLLLLLAVHGSLANLNEKLGLPRTDATLSQIKNRSITSRGKPKAMGVTMARRIERALELPVGWMDNSQLPMSYRQQRIAHVARAMGGMTDYEVDQTVKIVDTLAQPKIANGNTN